MRRVFATALLLASAISLAGCSEKREKIERQPDAEPAMLASGRTSPTLLFDPDANAAYACDVLPVSAEAFAYRSDWPSTPGFYSSVETTYYLERYYDYQGPGWTPDHLSRVFTQYRGGARFR